jgi:hypothetical protein
VVPPRVDELREAHRCAHARPDLLEEGVLDAAVERQLPPQRGHALALVPQRHLRVLELVAPLPVLDRLRREPADRHAVTS